MTIDIHDYLFPILGGKGTELDFEPLNILGTASCFYGNKYVTAGHSMNAAQTYESAYMGLIDKRTEQIYYVPLNDIDIHEDIDLATFEIPHGIENMSFKIGTDKLEMLSDVLACGFPHGLDLEYRILRNRAFKGYIINYGPFYQFPRRPNCYELSFVCPRGISGAPLLQFDTDYLQYLIYGYVIGNSNSEITVFKETEKTDDGSVKTIYEKTESTKFGIAIQVDELLKKLDKYPKEIFLK
jgi:hypothetical protein